MQTTISVEAADVLSGSRHQRRPAKSLGRRDKQLIRSGLEIVAAARENLAASQAKRAAAHVLFAESARLCECWVTIDVIA